MLNLGGGDLAQNMLEHHLNKHPVEFLCKDTKRSSKRSPKNHLKHPIEFLCKDTKTSPKTSPKNHLKHPIELLCKDTKTSPKISPKISIPVSLQIH